MICPVTYPASSDTRYAHAAAMSSGMPTRRTGRWRPTSSSVPPPKRPLRRGAPAHRGVDRAGRDGVDGDAARPELERQRLGQRDHATLRRRVVTHHRRPRLRARRRDVHDPAPLGLEHVGQRRLRAVEGAGEVHRDDALPLFRADVHESGRSRPCPPRSPGRAPGRGGCGWSLTASSTWARSETSTAHAIASPPLSRMPCAAHSAGSRSTSNTETLAPSRARRSLIASPIPEAPPVTIAVDPTNGISTPVRFRWLRRRCR